jgi:hypothetical protein
LKAGRPRKTRRAIFGRSFTFAGREPVRVTLKAPEKTEFIQDDHGPSIAAQNLRDALAASTSGRRWSGWLIDQMA